MSETNQPYPLAKLMFQYQYAIKKIIEHLLTKQEDVACYVCNYFEYPFADYTIDFVRNINDDCTFEGAWNDWKYAIPFDLVTGEVITEIETLGLD